MMNLLASLNGRLASNDIPSEVIPIVAIVFTFVWLIIKTLVSPFVAAKANKKAGANASPSGDEALLIRQMQQTLTKMEERVEALETILLEQSRSQKL